MGAPRRSAAAPLAAQALALCTAGAIRPTAGSGAAPGAPVALAAVAVGADGGVAAAAPSNDVTLLISGIGEQLRELRAGLESNVADLKSRFDGLESRFDGLESKVDGLVTSVNELLEVAPTVAAHERIAACATASTLFVEAPINCSAFFYSAGERAVKDASAGSGAGAPARRPSSQLSRRRTASPTSDATSPCR